MISAEHLDQDDLRELREGFLARMHPFGTFHDRPSTYWTEEREYKTEMMQLARNALTPSVLADGEPEAVLRAVKTVLTKKLESTGAPQNVVSWYYFDFLKYLEGDTPAFTGAFVRLITGSDDSANRVDRFVKDTWRMVRKKRGDNPYALTRIFPTFFLMLLSPGTDIAVRTDMFRLASQGLLGRDILQNQPFTGDEYREILSLSNAVREELESWGWMPADLIDVHSFLWAGTRAAPDEESA